MNYYFTGTLIKNEVVMNYYVTGTLIILLVAFALIVGPYPY